MIRTMRTGPKSLTTVIASGIGLMVLASAGLTTGEEGWIRGWVEAPRARCGGSARAARAVAGAHDGRDDGRLGGRDFVN